MPIRFIYFDVGNVLLAFSHERMCRQMADVAGIAPELVKSLMFEDDRVARLLVEFETGRVGPDAFYEAFCRATDTRPDPERLRTAAVDIFQPIEPVWDLVIRLAARGHHLGLLSNSNAMHWGFLTDGRFSLLAAPTIDSSPFEVAVASHEVGSMKPEAHIYEVAIERSGVAPHEILFVDDRPENIDAAREAGIDAVHFTVPDALLAALAVRRILVREQ